jgi:hypothetical protein
MFVQMNASGDFVCGTAISGAAVLLRQPKQQLVRQLGVDWGMSAAVELFQRALQCLKNCIQRVGGWIRAGREVQERLREVA